MAKFVLKDAFVEVDSNDLSNFASSVTIDTPADEVDITGFGSAYREFAQGLKDATITIAFFQDYAAASVHTVLSPHHAAGTSFALAIRADSGAVAPTNPMWTTTVRLFNYSPLSAAIGEAATIDVSFRNADQTGVVETTA
jgi:hypothetical protein